MHFRWFVIILIWFIGRSHFASTATEATLKVLPDEEVKALKDIGKALRKDWNFSVDPCSKDQGWVTPNSTKEFENNVSCNCTSSNCHVTGIVIKSQNLTGVLPLELFKLPFIQTIDLTRNYLSGTIPPQWASTKLEKISLGGNRLSGSIPKEIADITTLNELILDMNHFSGLVPSQLGSLPVLHTLILSSNNLTGPLPQELAKLYTMTDFRISDNQFTGPIPEFVWGWTNLQKIHMQASGLKGPILSTFSGLTQLQEMRFSDINGPEASFPNLSILKCLKTLILRSCNISGDIPAYIANLTELFILDLSFNKLTGPVPENFDNLQRIRYMYLSGNRLTWKVADWMSKQERIVDLSYNNITNGASNDCHHKEVNYFGSSLLGNDTKRVPCLENLSCQDKYYDSMSINCGGGKILIDGTLYTQDLDAGGASRFFKSDYNWVLSSTGHFMDSANKTDNYIAKNKSRLLIEDDQLYMTARLSPISLSYYGYCMRKGKYIVNLHFAEIVFTSDLTYGSLGRRIFDVYIQGKRVLENFNIESEAGGVNKEVKKTFPAVVNETLEIRLCWAGKGTQRLPTPEAYGPLISAISADYVPDGGISAGVVAGIVVSVLCFIFVVVTILWWKGCLRRKIIDPELRGLDLQTGSFTLRQIKVATNNFDPQNKIGEGGFGPVFKGLLSDGTIIAVKQLSSKSKQGNREFVNEIGMISAVQNPYLVKLFGCCIEGNQLLLVYEYLENNNLARALFGPEEFQIRLDWRTRHNICVGIAKGLAYLHEESRLKIVHRDIKATNVLLDKDLDPKISDFGLARLNEDDSTHISTRIAGTFGYMAPEYAMRGYLTDKADVYSFGIVALEIVSGRSNSNYKANYECVYLLDWAMVLQQKGDLMELVDPRLGSDYNKDEVMGMINIALACTHASSTLRPTMSSVVSMLEGRSTVQKFISDPNVPDDNSKFKDILDSYKERRDKHLVDLRTQSLSIEGPWTGPSTSSGDLYPLKLDSQYWRNRE